MYLTVLKRISFFIRGRNNTESWPIDISLGSFFVERLLCLLNVQEDPTTKSSEVTWFVHCYEECIPHSTAQTKILPLVWLFGLLDVQTFVSVYCRAFQVTGMRCLIKILLSFSNTPATNWRTILLRVFCFSPLFDSPMFLLEPVAILTEVQFELSQTFKVLLEATKPHYDTSEWQQNIYNCSRWRDLQD